MVKQLSRSWLLKKKTEMASPTLTSDDEAKLRLADRISVVNALQSLDLEATNSWLPATHPAIYGIHEDHAPSKSAAISAPALAEYLAVAAPTHCADGWGYLSRGFHSYLIGDPHSAWHFAYYAELRAAQSILSASGCGAFNRWNCCLDAAGNIQILSKQQTHVMVWLALDYLAGNSPSASAGIAAAMSILGVSTPEIVQYAYPGRQTTATSSNWVSSWIYDLQTSSSDKGFRNRCSYNPHFVTPHNADIGEYVSLVTAFWEMLEPSPGATFMELDRQIVRDILRKEARDSLCLNGKQDSPEEMKDELDEAYKKIVNSAPTFQSIPVQFITNPETSEHPLLHYARDNSVSPSTPRPVLARATLLLRIATGMTQNLLRDAGQISKLGFWLDGLAEQQGIVSSRAELPSDRSDLYIDCMLAAEDLQRAHAAGSVSLASLFENTAIKPYLLSQTERVVQWSFSN